MNKRILIADDEPHMLRVTELSLKKGGFEVILARDGRQAVELTTAQKPDLVVLDVVMPEMDGFEALRALKGNPETAGIPVIILTSRGQRIAQSEAESSGATLYLTKPFSPSELLAQARKLLGVA
jgi:DNA-binding response OmpR family regulator